MHTATRLLLLFAVLLACLCPALAQNSGSIAGEIRDEKQAVITGATVNVRNVLTNETRTAQTNADGRYRFANMAVGNYEITVESTPGLGSRFTLWLRGEEPAGGLRALP